MAAGLRHTIVLLIADDHDCGIETEAALAALGCIAHRGEPGGILDDGGRYDAAMLITRRNTSWSAMWLRALRSNEFACGSLVVLGSGGPQAVAESLRSGAVDCLIRPVSEPELIDSLAGVIETTRRWRARFSRARLIAESELEVAVERSPATTSAEPRDDAKIEEVVERLSVQSGLTRRERQVLYWLLLGHRYIDIATVLGVAPRTAKFHAANLLGKLDLDSRYDLSRLLAEELDRGE